MGDSTDVCSYGSPWKGYRMGKGTQNYAFPISLSLSFFKLHQVKSLRQKLLGSFFYFFVYFAD